MHARQQTGHSDHLRGASEDARILAHTENPRAETSELRFLTALSCECRCRSRNRKREARHGDIRFDFVAVQHRGEVHQCIRCAGRAACRRVSNAITILAKESRFEGNMLQHWGVHCFTCLIKTGLATKERELKPRSIKFPNTVDGPRWERVVCGTSQNV